MEEVDLVAEEVEVQEEEEVVVQEEEGVVLEVVEELVVGASAQLQLTTTIAQQRGT